MSEAKRKPDAKMFLELENKEIEIQVYVNHDFKGLRYEFTSEAVIEPLDAAMALLEVASTVCDKNGISLSALLMSYQEQTASDQTH